MTGGPRRQLVGWLPVIEYCAEEVRRQGRGPVQVGYMLDAWRIALQHEGPITNELVIRLGSTIEPGINHLDRYRGVGVRVGYDVKPDPREVPELMDRLLGFQSVITPQEFYREFEEVHPFRDGNGRTGKVLLNMLNGTMTEPVWPPDFWGVSNP